MFKRIPLSISTIALLSACTKQAKLELLADSYSKNAELIQVQSSMAYADVLDFRGHTYELSSADSIEVLGKNFLFDIEKHGLCHFDSFEQALQTTIDAQLKTYPSQDARMSGHYDHYLSQDASTKSLYYEQSLTLSKAATLYNNCDLRRLALVMFEYGQEELVLRISEYFWNLPHMETWTFAMAFFNQNRFTLGDTIQAEINILRFHLHGYESFYRNLDKNISITIDGDTIAMDDDGLFQYHHDGTERILDIKTSVFDPISQKTIVQNFPYKLQ